MKMEYGISSRVDESGGWSPASVSILDCTRHTMTHTKIRTQWKIGYYIGSKSHQYRELGAINHTYAHIFFVDAAVTRHVHNNIRPILCILTINSVKYVCLMTSQLDTTIYSVNNIQANNKRMDGGKKTLIYLSPAHVFWLFTPLTFGLVIKES